MTDILLNQPNVIQYRQLGGAVLAIMRTHVEAQQFKLLARSTGSFTRIIELSQSNIPAMLYGVEFRSVK